MNNTQLYLTIGVPTLTVILAWLFHRSDLNRLSDKLDANVARLSDRIDKLTESHHKDFETIIESQHKDLEKLTDSHHRDNLALMGYVPAS